MIFDRKDKKVADSAAQKHPAERLTDSASLSAEARELRHLSILLGLSKKLNSATDLESLLKDVVDNAIEITGAERGFLMLLENPVKLDHRLFNPVITPPPQAKLRMEFRMARSAAKKYISQENFKISMTIANRVAETGQPVWIRDVQLDPRFKSVDSIISLDLRTIICVALKLENQITGVLYVDSRFIVRAFTEEDLMIIEALSEHAAIAIGKARMYEELLEKAKIEQENQELRLLDRKKSDFINLLSHEIRTPLTVIQGYAERLKSSKTIEQDQVVPQASIIYAESKRLTKMVEELLDIARIKSGKDKINPVDADLTAIIETAIEASRSRAEAKQLKVYLAFSKRPIRMMFDTEKIYQLIFNLIDNGIKYTPAKGTLQIQADEISALEVQGDAFIASFAQVTVSDTGIGIALSDKEKVFDEFYRTGWAEETKERGIGLGLSICRGIVQAHGGRIWVESQPGKGSKFIFTLPNYQPISKLSDYKFRS